MPTWWKAARRRCSDAGELERLGFSIAIFPGGTVRALAHHLADYFASLKAHGTTAPFRDRMLDFKGINDIVGTDDMLEARPAL